MVELLSPAGDFESLKAAVQNGANAVYFGAENFSARAYAKNFNDSELEKAINYAKLRNVKTHLTLNTLIKDDEIKESFELAKKAYEYGIDAIIIQDIGLAKLLLSAFPDIELHASTQMSIHNLQGVLELEKLGFKRVVLSRELSLNEIVYICQNSNIEIECFIHGALCVSYSGQCLFSSMIGRTFSGIVGQCAQPCRLPYSLLENEKVIDNGFLLSTRDLCSLELLPELIKSGVKSFKIEGRMKSPTYVATVTRIYRKYINLAQSGEPYNIEETDKKQLLQVFNRGHFSTGHLSNKPNKNLVCKTKPNNMGLFLGIVEKYTKNRYITVKLNENLTLGDSIALENETGIYTISELMEKGNNVITGKIGHTVELGRMRGNINLGDKIYKITSKSLSANAHISINSENVKIPLNAHVKIHKGQKISMEITAHNEKVHKNGSYILLNDSPYKNLNISYTIPDIPIEARNQPLTKERISIQLNKTNDTPYEFKELLIDLDDNAFLPKISSLNELRRGALNLVKEYASSQISRISDSSKIEQTFMEIDKEVKKLKENKKRCKDNYETSLMLNILDSNEDYSKLEYVDKLYIPLRYFSLKEYAKILELLSSKFNIYISLPTIIKSNYKNILYENIEKSIKNYNIKGFLLSNISNIIFLQNINQMHSFDFDLSKFDLIANYTFNIFNHLSVDVIYEMGLNTYTFTPELDNKSMKCLCGINSIKKELIVYGRIPVINTNYCVLGNCNKCYPNCQSKCTSKNKYFLQDRMKARFPVISDNVQAVTTIFNYKNQSISPLDFDIDVARIDILYESVDEINKIIKEHKSNI